MNEKVIILPFPHPVSVLRYGLLVLLVYESSFNITAGNNMPVTTHA